MSNLNEVQDNIDSLVLLIFESVRSHSIQEVNNNSEELKNKSIDNLTEQYKKTINSIDNMLGNNRKSSEQLNEINELQNKIFEVKNSIQIYQQNLEEIYSNCQDELNILLSDDNILNQK